MTWRFPSVVVLTGSIRQVLSALTDSTEEKRMRNDTVPARLSKLRATRLRSCRRQLLTPLALSSARLSREKLAIGVRPFENTNGQLSILGTLASTASAAADNGRTKSTFVLFLLPGNVQF